MEAKLGYLSTMLGSRKHIIFTPDSVLLQNSCCIQYVKKTEIFHRPHKKKEQSQLYIVVKSQLFISYHFEVIQIVLTVIYL